MKHSVAIFARVTQVEYPPLGGELVVHVHPRAPKFMSVPFYYNHGPGASAQMKADLKRVRAAKPERYLTVKVKEQRVDSDGKTFHVTVNREPDAVAPTPYERHRLTGRAM